MYHDNMPYYTLPAKKLLANDSIRSAFVDPLSYMGIYGKYMIE
jgi:hypothetical protein